MKRILAAAMIVAATFGIAEAKEWTKVRIGTEGAYPPFNYFDSDNQLQGFDVDIAKALCDEMKVECEFVAQDWEGIIPALIANKYDAIIASMSITPERQEKVDFTEKYYSTPPALIAPSDSELSATDPGTLEGKTIGAQASTTHATFLEDVYKNSTIKLYGTQDEANLDLASGRLDAVAADSVVLSEWLKTDDGACCKMVGPMENDPQYFGDGAGIAVRKGEDDLREMFNKAIAAIRENGTYEKIEAKYFDFSVY
ncbi:ABC transporter substrate-binding protein [Tepidamorphus sp. 3E244]|uniref:ABC transporter substrate-binding protein n=1 Tax=Tepidamorphus sp. 3E244 TaxID=3385498 RepID=UPI0038FC22DC